ncbi:hypothetical protein OIV83_001862 [Microbotryomycetes sp. JL201]|nr:hypothetical protein OIV83_001862 [Microbotryomycetes sp. JL201]
MSDDPISTFFSGVDNVDLYEVLKVKRDASQQDIKSAYRRLALVHHPDKVAANIASSTSTLEDANLKFQQIGFAYSVLSDDQRRKRYDEQGKTDELASGKTEAEWREYFKELWQGQVTTETIEKFAQHYRGEWTIKPKWNPLNKTGSDEEKQDLFNAYKTFQGDIESILNNIMCSTHDDETRFVTLIDDAIHSRELPKFKQWTKSSKDTKAKQKRKQKAQDEATEAEAYAKELGVFEQLKNGKKTTGKGADKTSGGGKDDGDDEAGLRALIQGNQKKRMSALMDSLEAKYGGANDVGKKTKKRASTEGEQSSSKKGSKKQKEEEPSEEEFQKIQAEIESRRRTKKK